MMNDFQICKSKKVAFTTMSQANERAVKINHINIKRKLKIKLRPYKCEICGYYHLTKMTKRDYKYRNDDSFRIQVDNKTNEKNFIKEESTRWKEHFEVIDRRKKKKVRKLRRE